VSRNDFIVQLIADLTGKMIERRTSAEMSAFGIAFLAGLHSGMMKNKSKQGFLNQGSATYQLAVTVKLIKVDIILDLF